MARKPVIGLTCNYTHRDTPGNSTDLGVPGQDWELIAADYSRCIWEAGGVPLILPLTYNDDDAAEMLSHLDAVVFTGGSDISPMHYGEEPSPHLGPIEPARDAAELRLARIALESTSMPILGVCRGHQLLHVALGGTLHQHLETVGKFHSHSMFPGTEPSAWTRIIPGTRAADIFGPIASIHGGQQWIATNSYNHQGVKDPGRGLVTNLEARDGLIEGSEMEGSRFVLTVQWHPEMLAGPATASRKPAYGVIFRALVDAAR